MASKSDLDQIRSMISIALACVDAGIESEQNSRGEMLSAAWRLADAGLLLRRALESEGIEGFGVTEPTGRGAVLPA